MDVRLRLCASLMTLLHQFRCIVQCIANRVSFYALVATIQRDGHCLIHVHLSTLIVPILTHVQKIAGLMNNYVLEDWTKMAAQCLIIVCTYRLIALHIVMRNVTTMKYCVPVNVTL